MKRVNSINSGIHQDAFAQCTTTPSLLLLCGKARLNLCPSGNSMEMACLPMSYAFSILQHLYSFRSLTAYPGCLQRQRRVCRLSCKSMVALRYQVGQLLACSESLQRKVCACTSACVPCMLYCRNDEVTIQPVVDLAVPVSAVTVSAAYAHLGCATISAAAMLSA